MRRRLLAVALGTTVGVAVTEAGLRLVNAALHPAIYQLDAQLGWRHASGVHRRLRDERGREVTFVTDAEGLRIDPAAGAAPPATPLSRTVLFVGDSFTQGSQVEHAETFVARVGAALPDVRTLNAGVGGYSTLQESLALGQLLPRHRPQLVVLTVFDNDFADNLMPYFSGLGPRPYVTVEAEQITLRLGETAPFLRFLQPAPAAFWLYQHCAIYRAVQKNLFWPRHGPQLAQFEHEQRRALSTDDERAAMRSLLQQTDFAVRGAGARLLVAAMPTRQQVARGAAPWLAWLGEQCATQQVAFVSLLPTLQALGAERGYYETDIHLMRDGHEAVAAALAPAVAAALAAPR